MEMKHTISLIKKKKTYYKAAEKCKVMGKEILLLMCKAITH